ncbi:EamA family transporter [Candidatus Woesearchaeota archaeon]|nr:EamA family transporter [Candidatus Woesearchaeota archaeon]
MNTPWSSVFLVLIATSIGAFGALFLKYGANTMTRKSVLSFLNIRLLIGVFFYGLSSIFFLIALKNGELSVLYPLTSLSYIWISLLSIKMLHEKMNLYKWLGIAAILVGVTMIGFGS